MIVRVVLKVNRNLQKKSKYFILIHNPDLKNIQKNQITTQKITNCWFFHGTKEFFNFLK
jgi:hypothetical protein